MKINYNNEKHCVPFFSLTVRDVFCTVVDGENSTWMKVLPSTTEVTHRPFNAVRLDDGGNTSFAEFSHDAEVILPKSYHMDVEF